MTMRTCWACRQDATFGCEYLGSCQRKVCPDHMVDLGDAIYCEEHADIVQDEVEARRGYMADYDY